MTRPLRYTACLAAGLALALMAGPGKTHGNEAAGSIAASSDAAKRTVSTLTVSRAMTEWTQTFSGVLVAREEVAVGAPAAEQRIAEVEVEVGDRVTAGQVLVRLDPEMRDNQLREAEGRLARAAAALAQQKAKAEQATAALKRSEPLKSAGIISSQAYAEKLSNEAVEREGVTLARAEVSQAEAQLAESRRQRDRNVIVAPVDGIVSERQANAGALTGSEPLLRLIRGGAIEMAADIPERQLPLLAVGQPASIELAGTSDALTGKVRVVMPKIDRDSRLGVARIAVDGNARLFAGAFGHVRIVVAKRQAIVVDHSALLYQGRGKDKAVFVVEDGKVALQPVETGLADSSRVEIVGGLKEGDVVVAKAGPTLREGDAVAPVEINNTTGNIRP
ncbi:MAG: efflux RND transporter periplasmic adaptor subunit [Proteobacteria bacterium]|nr:efflux RND transporter periplasmic adaptor subunit [Pseudomonadota bacterium]